MPQAGFDPPGKKWQMCLTIVVALPPKPPWLDNLFACLGLIFKTMDATKMTFSDASFSVVLDKGTLVNVTC